jgi:hypothetical protein
MPTHPKNETHRTVIGPGRIVQALRRNADGQLNPKTGKYDGISSTYRIRMTPAFVVDPDKPMAIPKLVLDEDRKIAFEATKLAMIIGTGTRIPQLVPPGTSEAAVEIMEGLLEALPSADYFLKKLYRQHYPGEDEYGFPPWADKYRRYTPLKAAPKKPLQQVDAGPVTASAKP